MRNAIYAATAAMLAGTMPAAAQDMRATGPRMQHRGGPDQPVARPGRPQVNLPGPRWGGRVQGRWHGGHFAPGGWAAYRVPVRGTMLPPYWIAPSFYVADFATYGLVAPRAGLGWYRYYDDAVLVDRDARVIEYRSGVDWDARDNGRYVRDAGYYDRYERDHGGTDRQVARRDDGVGGAVIGGVAGAVAGNVLAGRGDRLAGTALGAGVGALAGVAVDQAEDHRRIAPPPPPSPLSAAPPLPRGEGYDDGYGASYPAPGYGDVPIAPDDGYGPNGEPPIRFAEPREQVQRIAPAGSAYSDHRVQRHPVPGGEAGYSATTVQTGGGYVSGGYYYPPQTVTTITFGAPTVTTTTTTTEEIVTGSGSPGHRSARRHMRGTKALCRC